MGNNKYTLRIEENNSFYEISRCNLYLKDEDIDKVRYLKEISEEYNKKFGCDSDISLLGLDVTDVLYPEPPGHIYKGMRSIVSRLTYVGDDEFIVRKDFVDDCDDPSYIITERFKIDL